MNDIIDPQSISKYLFRSLSKFDLKNDKKRVISDFLRQLPPPQPHCWHRWLILAKDVAGAHRREARASPWGLVLTWSDLGDLWGRKMGGNPIEMQGFQSIPSCDYSEQFAIEHGHRNSEFSHDTW